MPDGPIGNTNSISNLVEFNGHQRRSHHHDRHHNGDPDNGHDSETISEHSQTESLLTESQQKLYFEKSKNRRISKSSNGNTSVKTATTNGDNESSPLLSASVSAHKIDPVSSSPSLEAKVNLTGNFLEYYLPKHDDDEWTNGLNNNYKRKNILQYPSVEEANVNNNKIINNVNKKNKKDKATINGHSVKTNSTNELSCGQKPMTLLTFNSNHRSSLNESTDIFSLLTPSSSTSTTPMAGLAQSSSISDTTNDQCSSSLSSGSNPLSDHNNSSTSVKSPINNNSLYVNTQHLYANTGPNTMTSFGYGSVNLNCKQQKSQPLSQQQQQLPTSSPPSQQQHSSINNNGTTDTMVVSKLNATNIIKSVDQQPEQQPIITKPKIQGSSQTTYV